jgi:hypothetical protein
MDEKIPRPVMPKTALPPELRKKMGLKPRKEEEESSYDIYKPGSGVLAPVGSGKDGTFLKMKSSVPKSLQDAWDSSRYSCGYSKSQNRRKE